MKQFAHYFIAVATGAAPWIDRFTSFPLISSYYRPTLDAIVAGISIGMFFVTPHFFRKAKTLPPKLIGLGISIVLFFVGLTACFFLYSTVGITFDPGPNWTGALRTAWFALYLLTFVSFAVAASLAELLYLK